MAWVLLFSAGNASSQVQKYNYYRFVFLFIQKYYAGKYKCVQIYNDDE